MNSGFAKRAHTWRMSARRSWTSGPWDPWPLRSRPGGCGERVPEKKRTASLSKLSSAGQGAMISVESVQIFRATATTKRLKDTARPLLIRQALGSPAFCGRGREARPTRPSAPGPAHHCQVRKAARLEQLAVIHYPAFLRPVRNPIHWFLSRGHARARQPE